jgi:ABC-type sugar transport system ATPase subunit
MTIAQNRLVELNNISKQYPGVQALDNVSLDLLAGEVHCLVGENGAGKSTLMRILSGAELPDNGEIRINGTTFSGLNPADGVGLGIAMIHQETELVGPMSVAHNIFLGHEPLTSFGMVDRKRMYQEATALLDRIGMPIPPKIPVRDLRTANKKLVQIAKALSRDCRIMIMDEPGATLSDHELDKLFDVIRQLGQAGIGVIYISHRLNEVLDIGDRVTVLRQGQNISTLPIAEVTIPSLIHDMVGRDLSEQYTKTPSFEQDNVVLSVNNLSWGRHVRNVSFDLRRGEVLGLAGLVGAGRSELLNCIFGSAKPDSGEISVFGKPVKHKSPKDMIELGVGLLPEERRDEGLVLCLGVDDNINLPILQQLVSFIFINSRKFQETAKRYIDSLRIATPSLNQIVQNLSGGNQQKVVVSKWLAADAKILLLDEPTRGVDVGAKSEIYQLIDDLTNRGVSVLMASSELPEIIGMSDRIMVMAEGKLTKIFPNTDNITQNEIMKYAVVQGSEG